MKTNLITYVAFASSPYEETRRLTMRIIILDEFGKMHRHVCISINVQEQLYVELVSDINLAGIQDRFAFSPTLFSKATEVINRIFKNVSRDGNVKTIITCHMNIKTPLKERYDFNYTLWKEMALRWEVFQNMVLGSRAIRCLMSQSGALTFQLAPHSLVLPSPVYRFLRHTPCILYSSASLLQARHNTKHNGQHTRLNPRTLVVNMTLILQRAYFL
ncbi:hypothetical protein E2C01_034463 [Portunus trituberculatus]|uniref:Uncharacterized protein n=1 Tax=Portunus trituberculatus TaxID=210409 RepID=A0A5B7F6Q7_PORTR|nr:hypothetical protein [Portunus trituberculatus]